MREIKFRAWIIKGNIYEHSYLLDTKTETGGVLMGDETKMAAAKLAWENAFEKGVYLDHKPAMEEIFDLRILAVYEAGIKEGEGHDQEA